MTSAWANANSAANWVEVTVTLAILLAAGLAVLVVSAAAALRVRPARDLHAE